MDLRETWANGRNSSGPRRRESLLISLRFDSVAHQDIEIRNAGVRTSPPSVSLNLAVSEIGELGFAAIGEGSALDLGPHLVEVGHGLEVFLV
jgi:hypothetical protein